MTDEEMLRYAAKAAGIDLSEAEWHEDGLYWMPLGTRFWNPLTDDGDALRLAVKLKLIIDPYVGLIGKPSHGWTTTINEGDPYAATRRAIVRAAAKIGEQHGN